MGHDNCNLEIRLNNLYAMYQFLERNIKYIDNRSHFSDNIITKIRSLFTSVESKIYIFCDHDIIYDSIDITPDKSIQIKYCSKCSLTI